MNREIGSRQKPFEHARELLEYCSSPEYRSFFVFVYRKMNEWINKQLKKIILHIASFFGAAVALTLSTPGAFFSSSSADIFEVCFWCSLGDCEEAPWISLGVLSDPANMDKGGADFALSGLTGPDVQAWQVWWKKKRRKKKKKKIKKKVGLQLIPK